MVRPVSKSLRISADFEMTSQYCVPGIYRYISTQKKATNLEILLKRKKKKIKIFYKTRPSLVQVKFRDSQIHLFCITYDPDIH